MKKISITLLMMLLVQISLLAQNNHSIYGVIREDDGTPLVNAVISFCDAADSTRQYPTVCDLKGYFKQILPAQILNIFSFVHQIICKNRLQDNIFYNFVVGKHSGFFVLFVLVNSKIQKI